MWRHIVLWKEKQVVLLDLGTLEKESNQAKQEDWCKKSIEELRQKAGMQIDAKAIPTATRTNAERQRHNTPGTGLQDLIGILQ
jgi:hypothetical protein